MLNPDDRAKIERFAALLRSRLRGAQVIAFGSRVRGDATADSDLDVLVVVERVDRATREIVNDAAWQASYPEVVMAPVLISRDDFGSGPGRTAVFLQTVRREGEAA